MTNAYTSLRGYQTLEEEVSSEFRGAGYRVGQQDPQKLLQDKHHQGLVIYEKRQQLGEAPHQPAHLGTLLFNYPPAGITPESEWALYLADLNSTKEIIQILNPLLEMHKVKLYIISGNKPQNALTKRPNKKIA